MNYGFYEYFMLVFIPLLFFIVFDNCINRHVINFDFNKKKEANNKINLNNYDSTPFSYNIENSFINYNESDRNDIVEVYSSEDVYKKIQQNDKYM